MTSNLEFFLRKIRCTKTEAQLIELIKKLTEFGINSLSDLNRLTENDWKKMNLDDVRARVQLGFDKINKIRQSKIKRSISDNSSSGQSHDEISIESQNLPTLSSSKSSENLSSIQSKGRKNIKLLKESAVGSQSSEDLSSFSSSSPISSPTSLSPSNSLSSISVISFPDSSEKTINRKSHKSLTIDSDSSEDRKSKSNSSGTDKSSLSIITESESEESSLSSTAIFQSLNCDEETNDEVDNKITRKDIRNILLNPESQKKFIDFLLNPSDSLQESFTSEKLNLFVSRIHLWNECQKYEKVESLFLTKAHVIWQKYLINDPYEQTGISSKLIEYIKAILWNDVDGTDNKGFLTQKTFRPICAWIEESLRTIGNLFQETISTIQITKKRSFSILKKRSART
jgi:hypothetical protein